MSSKPARQFALGASLLGILAVVVATTTGAATLEQETATKVEQIRAIKAGQSSATIATYNQEMDAAWKFYASHKPEILPILRAQLKMRFDILQVISRTLAEISCLATAQRLSLRPRCHTLEGSVPFLILNRPARSSDPE
jgi:hypothetical protein